MVAIAACETLAFLIVAALDGWAPGLGNVTLPRPDGYYALLLLGGVLVAGSSERGAPGATNRRAGPAVPPASPPAPGRRWSSPDW